MSSSDSDSSGPEDRAPPKKKSKQVSDDEDSDTASASKKQDKKQKKTEKGDKKKSKSGSAGVRSKDGSEISFEIAHMRYLKVRQFKGKLYIDIREYYEKDGNVLPGKKGISLNREQWRKVKEMIGDVDDAIEEMS